MNIPEIATGLTVHARRTTTSADTATALGSGTVEVLGTPAMIALMEEAAVATLAGVLPGNLTSVGIYLEVHHLAATPPGMEVWATATVTEVDRREISFEVEASDSVGIIGRGLHRRVIVDQAKFLQRAQEKFKTS
jgi:fluoroacetyl-CoA thioesterase